MIEPVDIPSVAQLNGIFAPTTSEVDGPMEVVAGAVPADLAGAYLRNGPNPRFPPIGSYSYPLDGDGMIHGVWFEGGRARYRNRFVRTPAIEAEEAAGRALWPGVMDLGMPDPDDVPPELVGTERDLVDIHIVRHAGRYLALSEGQEPFAVDAGLATLGPCDFDGGLPDGMCAHPKVDPVTGEMVVFRYDVMQAPWLTWAVVGADGTVTSPPTALDVAGPYMIHDCAITASHLVLFVCPLHFDLEAAFAGGNPLGWRPEEGSRIAVVDRGTGAVTWFEAEAFWVWHIANAYVADTGDGGTEVVVDMPRWLHPGMGLDPRPAQGGAVRVHLDLASGTCRIDEVGDELAEFPRIDDRLLGQPHRWVYMAGKDPDDLPTVPGEWNRVVRLDTATGATDDRRGGRTRFGEPVFVPRDGSRGEDDGYLLAWGFHEDTLATHLFVLDPADVGGEPVAVLAPPQRVPYGLHGSWIPADDL